VPDWPDGMRMSGFFGLSSNQQFMSVPASVDVKVDDYVYFRPTQSEAVLDQFGALTVIRAGGVERWPAFERNT
jgi:D-serine deaminase-like pyridoxal phosphate-dependent protein